MFQVYTGVQVTDETLERHGQAGVVLNSPKAGDPVEVKFEDPDGDALEHFDITQLRGL